MKMTLEDDHTLARSHPGTPEDTPSAQAIGSEFARQYYTLLAESPSSVHRFYSHESTLLLNDASFVGQLKIGQAIEDHVAEKCRIRIVSVKGINTSNNGIVLQVFGEMKNRRFVQTFVLSPQGEKKYFVQSDLFQFIDLVFDDLEGVKISPYSKASSESGVRTSTNDNLDASGETPILAASPVPPMNIEKENGIGESPSLSTFSDLPENLPPREEVREIRIEKIVEDVHVQAEVSPPVIKEQPKTWANMVVGSAKPAAPPSKNIGISNAAVKTKSPVKPLQHSNGPNTGNQDRQNGSPAISAENRLYIGGIKKISVPEISVAENDIKEFFSKYGDVENVSVPRKALDSSEQNKPAFAFITMKSAVDAQQILKRAKKDDREGFSLPVKLDSFNFEGEAIISEMRERHPNFRSRGGFTRGGGPGSRGRGGRGGFRGNAQHNGH